MEKKEFTAMVSLLKDNDFEVINAITESLLKEGAYIIPELERAWENTLDDKIQERIESLIQEIQFASLKKEMKNWIKGGATDILEGAFLIAKFNSPHIGFKTVNGFIENIKKDIWLEINDNLTALEKVKIINYILYRVYKFDNTTSDVHMPHLSYINQVIESKKGNHISLAILYLSISRKLDLPIYGVNLPGNFILAYMDTYQQTDVALDDSLDILFYINPFNKGAVLGRKEIDLFIKQQRLESLRSYYYPCSNQEIIIRLISDLMISYEKQGNIQKADRLQVLLNIARNEIYFA